MPSVVPASDVERHAVDRAQRAVVGAEARHQVVDAKEHGDLVTRFRLRSDLRRQRAAIAWRLRPAHEIARPLRASLRWLVPARGSRPRCIERDRLCASTTECGTTSACIAGRCQPTLKDDAGRVHPTCHLVAARSPRRRIADGHRVREFDGARCTLPIFRPCSSSGRKGDSAALLLRFAVPIAGRSDRRRGVRPARPRRRRRERSEAHLAPRRPDHRRLGRTIHLLRAPAALGRDRLARRHRHGHGRPLVRIDVRDLVTHWKARDPRDQGIAIVADDTSRTGMAFAAASSVVDQGSTSMLGHPPNEESPPSRWAAAPPRLELYLRPAARMSPRESAIASLRPTRGADVVVSTEEATARARTRTRR